MPEPSYNIKCPLLLNLSPSYKLHHGMNRKVWLWIGVAVLFWSACSRPYTIYFNVDPFLKSMFNWQAGSYWIMQDSASGQVDSFYVTAWVDFYINSENRAYERFYVVLEEKNNSNLADSFRWYLSFP